MPEKFPNPDIMSPEEEAVWDALEQKLALEKKTREKREAIKTLKTAGEEPDKEKRTC